mmetsp:Transcript_4520/g.8435  ORF Transcript_4520/g.8435 Transcript_4520/m.8435 type:complete len:352 (+) Transcript_4520:283-1338(+)|eukprot:CAMPEP_0114248636 /NCGR_PEP_ID=MMETSP0058-20121206/13685_1 /TAXON_ID=36894 /ORGANISM="Pyramimonas parkeae, CCMP726" /LENGTH=351 /DNA_ID=CAMNT_0001362069 /DNA_START=232 /DNA_END=1287 /DNA_ORIENTATION=+
MFPWELETGAYFYDYLVPGIVFCVLSTLVAVLLLRELVRPWPLALQSERFAVECDDALQHLRTHGFVVFRRVLNEEEVMEAKDLLWKYLQGTQHGIFREHWQTWQFWPTTTSVGKLESHGIGQSQFMWFVRTREYVRRCFERVHANEDLIVSFDGCMVFRPWQYFARWKTAAERFHVDQEPDDFRTVVQAFVALTNVDEQSGGLVLLPGSHLEHAAHCRVSSRENSSADYISWDEASSVLRKHKVVLPKVKKGDMVMWDSRTIHAFRPALRRPKAVEPDSRDLLCVMPCVTMVPREWASQAVQMQRQDAVKRVQTTSALPHKHVIVDNPFGQDRMPPFNRRRDAYGSSPLI